MNALAQRPHSATVHATAVLVGETAVILRGASGAGKSAAALALLAAAQDRGLFARLVADDRVFVSQVGNRVIVAPHPAIAGRIEQRFVGIRTVPHEAEAVASLVVDLTRDRLQDPSRLPDTQDAFALVAGVRLPRLAFPAGAIGTADAIMDHLSGL